VLEIVSMHCWIEINDDADDADDDDDDDDDDAID